MRKIVFVMVVPALLMAGTVSHNFNFPATDLTINRIAGYDVVSLRGAGHTTEIGTPLLPRKAIYLLVPSNAVVTGVRVTVLDSVALDGSYRIFPVQKPVTTNETGAQPIPALPSYLALPSDSRYPGSALASHSTGNKSNFQLCGVLLNPIQYDPATGSLELYRTLRVDVEYSERSGAGQQAVSLTPSQKLLFGRDVSLMVANPEDVARFAPPVRARMHSGGTDDYEIDYLVITGQQFASDFQPFCDWKTNKGIRTEVRTINWINSIYPGRDLPEKMRNCVIDFFEHRGLMYLLLAGDVDIVPDRQAHAYAGGETGGIPCDLYFGDLQGDWDANHNNLFGEYDDSVDMLADIYVGRIAIDNSTDVSTFTNKVLSWEQSPDTSRLATLLLPSGWLWQEYNYHGHIVNDQIASLFPGDWEKASLIDPGGSDPTRDSINAGFCFCHAAGHGNQQGVYSQNGTPIWVSSDAQRQTNGLHRLCIMNSMACDPGDIEYSDCLAELATNNPNGGLIAAIMNARYGWGTPPSLGPSERLDLTFYDYVFNYDSTDLGIEHARSKDYYQAEANSDEYMRYCVYELNLLGDPQLPLWHGVARHLNVSCKDTVRTGPDTLHVVVTSAGVPVPNALVCAHKGAEVYASGRTNYVGVLDLMTCAAIPGTMTLFVSTGGYYTCQDTLTVIPGQPLAYLSYDSYSVDDAGQSNPDHELEPGEADRVYVAVRNIGTLNATNVRGRLHSATGYLTLTDSLCAYGTVAAGGVGQGDGFLINVHGNAPQNIYLDMELEVTSDQGSWAMPFQVYDGFTGLSVADIDSFGGLLSVTAMGALGYDARPASLGRGFMWNRTATSSLYYGSFMFSGFPSDVTDNYYSHPSSTTLTDWRLTDSLRYVIPLWGGTEQVTGAYCDIGSATPHDLRVRQSAFSINREGYDHFVILIYDITNAGAQDMSQSYAGLACDFDVRANDKLHDQGRTVSSTRTAYMWNELGQTPTVGIHLLSADPLSNATIIDPFRYHYADSAMTKDMKYRLLNGDIRLEATSRCADWAVAVATGPLALASGATHRVAFAIAGGADSASFLASCDSAQSWYDRFVGIEEPKLKSGSEAAIGLFTEPNPSHGRFTVSYALPGAGVATLKLYDADGRLLRTLFAGRATPGRHTQECDLTSRRYSDSGTQDTRLVPGVYFLKLKSGTETKTAKVLIAE